METGAFTKALENKGDRDLLEMIQKKILENPEAGDVMPGCGGVRKMRVADPNRHKGTRGGLRVLYLDLPHKEVTHLIFVFGKDETENISAKARERIKEIAAAAKKE
ncbi:MAG: type II toxin-antitoxin system RelE/ParE family toxin [Bdellovibrionota bacterium]